MQQQRMMLMLSLGTPHVVAVSPKLVLVNVTVCMVCEKKSYCGSGWAALGDRTSLSCFEVPVAI